MCVQSDWSCYAVKKKTVTLYDMKPRGPGELMINHEYQARLTFHRSEDEMM